MQFSLESQLEESLQIFSASDGETIEVGQWRPISPERYILICPCGLGDVRTYIKTLPESLFERGDSHFIFYNPRGHGKARGRFAFDLASGDFLNWRQAHLPKELPFYGLGHSGGCIYLANIAKALGTFERLFFFAPILNTCEFVRFVYRSQKPWIFTNFVGLPLERESKLNEFFASDHWCDSESWVKNGCRDYLNQFEGISNPQFSLLGRALTDIVVAPAFQLEDLLVFIRDYVEIYQPNEDEWFPIDYTKELAQRNHIPIHQIATASDHFFRGVWPQIWKQTLGSL